jgi:uroporphyrinogen-III synthase
MRRLFVLRPQPGADETVARATALGLDVVAMPLFAIERVEWAAPGPAEVDALLMTSANAVREAGDGLARYRALPVHAVGEATAAAARDAGFAIASIGNNGAAQAVEAIPAGLRLLHLCGEHRRLPPAARQHITSNTVYRSRALPPPAMLPGIEGQVAAVHSPRAAARLAELVADRSKIRIAAISAAAAAAAGGGWERVEAAGTPADAQLLALAARLCQNPDPQ